MKLLLRSLPYLRREQLLYRPLRLAQFRLYKTFPQTASRYTATPESTPRPSSQAIEIINSALKTSFHHFARPLDEYNSLFANLLDDRFTFLNHTLEIKTIDWNRRYVGHLWNYQFHYFSYALPCARAFVERSDAGVMQKCQALIESWIDKARIGQSDGWDAYPISLRTVNWIYAYALLADAYKDRNFIERLSASLYQQLEFLSRHLEYHLLSNHLLENAKALVIGGLFFADDEQGQRWLREGERLLWREFDEQVLSDGGHYERSPMYHAIVLADFIECFALLREWRNARNEHWPEAQKINAKLQAMTRFLEAMTYSDGTLALFNDSANEELARPLPIISSAHQICEYNEKPFSQSFPETGYFCWSSPDGNERIVVDAGPMSVDYNMAHGHCDLLSYEMWLQGKPFIVDSGVHGYGGDRFREYARSTRAHNTVMFDGREQSELWGTFRVARRAKVIHANAKGDELTWDFCGAYAPFYALSLTHERRIQRESDGSWVITDQANSGSIKNASSFIHLHPDIRVKQISNSQSIECSNESLSVIIEPFAAENVQVIEGSDHPIQGWYFPAFGVARTSATIQFDYKVQSGKPFGYRIKSCSR